MFAGCSAGVFAFATAAATIGTYVLAGVAVAGIATFAMAESIAVYSGNNFMSGVLGSAYGPVKAGLYAIPIALGIMSEYAPQSYYVDKADRKLQKIIDNPKSVQQYSQKEFRNIADQSSWTSKVTKNGYGYRAYNDRGNLIMNNFHGNRNDLAHNFGDAY